MVRGLQFVLCIGVVAAVFLLLGCIRLACATEPKVYDVTVCELLRHPNAFDGRAISVQATFVGGLLEHTVIADASCPDLGGVSVANDNHKGIKDHLIRLAKAMQRARLMSNRTSLRTVRARLTGRFMAGSKSAGGAELLVHDATAIEIVAAMPIPGPPPP